MKVSIITPSYNQGRFIYRTLQSVATQSGAEIEHVIYDGGSSDETVDILKNFGHGIRWISEKDKGQAHAVNKGISTTNGEIIGWLNSDDIYYPGAIAIAAEIFSNYPEVEVVYGMAEHVDPDDEPFECYPTEPWDYERLKEICFICQPALFFRRRLVEQHGLLDESLIYCMDYEYWLRLGKAGARFVYLKEKLAGSRLYAENKTISARVRVHEEINDMLKKHLGTVPDRWLINYAYAKTEDSINRNDFPILFQVNLMIMSAYAFSRWNLGALNNLKATFSKFIPVNNTNDL